MPKERWAQAEEIESQFKAPLDPKEINAESYELPVLTVEIGESDNVDLLAAEFLDGNLPLKDKIDSEKLDIVAHEVVEKSGKRKWILIIGFGFAALGLGIMGYKLIHKHKKPDAK